MELYGKRFFLSRNCIIKSFGQPGMSRKATDGLNIALEKCLDSDN